MNIAELDQLEAEYQQAVDNGDVEATKELGPNLREARRTWRVQEEEAGRRNPGGPGVVAVEIDEG